MGSLIQDLRHAARMLSKRPAVTLAAVITLALGIGANTAIFSLVDAVVLRPLAFREAGRLAWVWATRTDRDKAFYSIPNFVDTRDRSIFNNSYAASGTKTGPVAMGGIRFSGDTATAGMEIRYQAAEANLAPPFAGTCSMPSCSTLNQ